MQLIAITALVFLGACGLVGKPMVRIHNKSSAPLSNMTLSGQGFSVSLLSLRPGETRKLSIRPHGESSISVSFTANGKRYSNEPQGYFENNPLYVVDVTVKPDLSVAVESTLQVIRTSR
jgi:hypothetical protein